MVGLSILGGKEASPAPRAPAPRAGHVPCPEVDTLIAEWKIPLRGADRAVEEVSRRVKSKRISPDHLAALLERWARCQARAGFLVASAELMQAAVDLAPTRGRESALASCRKALALEPQPRLKASRILLAEHLILQASDLLKKRRIDQARLLIRRSNAIMPSPNTLLVLSGLSSGREAAVLRARALALAEKRAGSRVHPYHYQDPLLPPSLDVKSPAGRFRALAKRGRLVITNRSSGAVMLVKKGHALGVSSVAFGPQDRVVASGDGFGRIRVWSLPSGRLLNTLMHSPEPVWHLAVDPGARLIAGGFSRQIRFWDLASGLLVFVVRIGAYGQGVMRFDSSGKLLFVTEYGTLYIIDIRSQKLVRRIRTKLGQIHEMSMSSDLGRVTLTGKHGYSQIIAFPSGKAGPMRAPRAGRPRLSAHTRAKKAPGSVVSIRTSGPSPIGSLAFCRTSGALAVGADKSVALWDLSAGRFMRSVGGRSRGRGPFAIHLDLPARRLISALPGEVLILDPKTGKKASRIQAPYGSALAHNGQFMARQDRSGQIEVLALPSGRSLHRFGTGGIHNDGIEIHSSGRLVAVTRAESKKATVWDTRTGKRLRTFVSHSSLYDPVFNAAGDLIATRSFQDDLFVREIRTGRLLKALRGKSVISYAFMTRGRTMVCGTEKGEVYIWSFSSGKVLRKLNGPSGEVLAVAVDGTRQRLAAGTSTGSVWLWETRGYTLLGILTASEGQWLVRDAQGFADGSRNGRSFLHWQIGGETHDFRLAWDLFHVPGLLCRSLRKDHAFRLGTLTSLLERIRRRRRR